MSTQVSLLTGGADKPYALGLASSLIAQGVEFDFIGSDYVDGPELHGHPSVRFLNLRGDQRPDVNRVRKVWRVVRYYCRLLHYAATSEPKVFHILWNSRLEWLDRTLILIYYRLLGKRIVFTAHNVNVRERDGGDTRLNRLTLGIQYRLVDHIFVHTDQMKRQLTSDFRVPDGKVSVIPFGVNSTVPDTALTRAEARRRLGLIGGQRTILFFGNIAPYKGLEYLVEAMIPLAQTSADYRLVIAGRPKGSESYWSALRGRIASAQLEPNVIERIEYVPDEETEVYFKAADVLVLPYTHVFQSGVLFLGYNFGLPVIASDVGSLREDIVEGQTGFVCTPRSAADLAATIERYFASDLYRELDTRRQTIRIFAHQRYSWSKVGMITGAVYSSLLTAGAERSGISDERLAGGS
jgi:D-inositol-3-phosphate glycosyltransferase